MFAITIGMLVAFTAGVAIALADMGMEATDWSPPAPVPEPIPVMVKWVDDEEEEELSPLEAEVTIAGTIIWEEEEDLPLPEIAEETAELLLPSRRFNWPLSLPVSVVEWEDTSLLPVPLSPEIRHLLETGERIWAKKAETTMPV